MSTEFEFDVFLSHNSEDKPLVELIAQRLKTEFGLNPFLDKWNLMPGKTWPNELERALDQSATTAVFLGTGGKGPWHDQEMQRALVKAVKTHEEYRIIPVLLPGADDTQVSGFLSLRTWVDFRDVDDEEAFNRLVGGIKGEAIDTGGFKLPGEPAPYQGLNRFEKEQADLFFGRTQDIEDLVTKLGNERFVAVLGASGSGKSSLVRAGLLPRLEQDALPGSKAWRVIIFLPGSEPLRALANQLAHELPRVERKEAADRLVTQLGEGENGLRDTLTSWYADSPVPLLLVIDQFEELFTQCNSETRSAKVCREASKGLIAGLADLVQSGGGDIRVVITLRADFLDRCLEFPVLRELLQDRQLLLGELGDEALREAIVLPAQKVGAFFEKGLVNLILRDVTGERGSLPLLQHALLELWKARCGPWLTQDAYDESGGVTGALKRFAQRIYEGLKPDEQTIARNIFVRITSLGEGVSDTRRRVPRGDLYPAGVEPATVDHVIEKLSGKDARLIVAGDEGVEVTHESLLQEWDTLRGWLESNRDAQRLRQQITEAAQLWRNDGGSDDDLYKGARLELAEQWEQEHPNTLTDLEQAFLDAGRAWRSKQQEKLEREQQEKEVQRQKELEMARELAEKERLRAEEKAASEQRLRKRAWGLGLAMVIAVVFMAGAIWYWMEAERATKLARVKTEEVEKALKETKRQKRSANNRLAKYFISEAKEMQKKKANLSLLLSVEALRMSGLPSVQSGFREILTKVQTLGLPLIGHEGDINAVAFDPKGRRLASAGKDGTVRVWDLNAPGAEPLVLRGHEGSVNTVAFDPLGAGRLASAGNDGTVRVWDLNTPAAELLVMRGHGGSVNSVAFDPLGSGAGRLASTDGTVRVWDLNTPEVEPLVLRGNGGGVDTVAFDPLASGAGRLAGAGHLAGESEGTIWVWDLNTPEAEPLVLRGHKYSIFSVAFDPLGPGAGRLASAGNDGTVRVWDLNTPEAEPLVLRGHKRWVHSVAFDPLGSRAGRLASAGRDGTVRVWNLDVPKAEPLVLRGHEGSVNSIAFDPLGTGVGQLASAGSDGMVRMWDLTPAEIEPLVLRGHEDRVFSVAFDPLGPGAGRLASSGYDDAVRVWDLNAPEAEPLVLRDQKRLVFSVAFDPLGSGAGRLAGAGMDGTVRVWDLNAPEAEPLVLSGHEGRVNSVAYDPLGSGARRLASAGSDGTVRVWDLNTPEAEPLVLRGNEGGVNSVAFDPLGSGAGRLAGAGGGTLWVWDLNTPEAEPLLLRGHEDRVSSVAFDPWRAGAGRLASAGYDGTVRVWDLNTPGAEPLVLRGHEDRVYSVAFDPLGAWRLASAGKDGTVRVWDLNTPEAEPLVLRGHYGPVSSVAFDPQEIGDGRLASAGTDSTIRVWSLNRTKLLNKGCRVSHRNLSKAEWKKYFGDEALHLTCPDRPIHPDYLQHGKKLASEGEIDQAVTEFTRVQKQFEKVPFDPLRLAGRYAARTEVAKGDELARSEDTEAAVTHYQRAVKLDPSWHIVPANRAAEVSSWAKVKEGDRRAGDGNIAVAITAYQQALEHYPVRQLKPEERAHRLAARAIRANAPKLAKAGKVDQALADYRHAGEWNADLSPNPNIEQRLCWFGSLWNRAVDVLPNCEQAVADDPSNGGYKDSRGVARALTGDLQGAAEDFRAYLEWGTNHLQPKESLKKRRQWIETLKSGRNPFDTTAQEALRQYQPAAFRVPSYF